jgi:hypothetical protein
MANYLKDCLKRCAKIVSDADNTGRATGRTTGQMIALRDGDVFVVHNAQFAEQTKISILPKNVKVIYAATLEECVHKTRGLKGAVIIDHHAQTMFLQATLRDFSNAIDCLAAQRKP